MPNPRDLQSWPECAPRLVDVAAGRAPRPTSVIRNGRWVNVYSGEIIPHAIFDVAIAAGRFALIGNAGRPRRSGPPPPSSMRPTATSLPGLCDGHMHVESGMVTATEFARAVIPHGTTSLFVDPHEIGNVLGLAGVRLMHDEAARPPSHRTCSCRCRALRAERAGPRKILRRRPRPRSRCARR